ncbi:MAG TPA: alpha/beta hydrolase [Kofleriaceae bacterium]|nr:alpha/beta hydrolase [Kofleriaceae bacterium]
MTTSMYVHELGEGPVVLLLHGTPSPASDWMPVAERLASRYRVLVPDLPAYGESPAPADASFETVGDALAKMLAERGAKRVHAVAGFCSGAYRAFELALRSRIETSLVIGLGAIVTLDEAARAERRGFARAIEADPTFLHSPALRDILRQLMLSPTWAANHPADLERIYAWADLCPPPALVAELDALAAIPDLRSELPHLNARVYLRVGELDANAPPSVSAEICRLAANATMDVVRACGHSLLIEDLDGTIAALERELEATPTT